MYNTPPPQSKVPELLVIQNSGDCGFRLFGASTRVPAASVSARRATRGTRGTHARCDVPSSKRRYSTVEGRVIFCNGDGATGISRLSRVFEARSATDRPRRAPLRPGMGVAVGARSVSFSAMIINTYAQTRRSWRCLVSSTTQSRAGSDSACGGSTCSRPTRTRRTASSPRHSK